MSNLSRTLGFASDSVDIGKLRRRWSSHGLRVRRRRHMSSTETPNTRMNTNSMCLHGAVRSGQLHDGVVERLTVYTLPVAPKIKKVVS